MSEITVGLKDSLNATTAIPARTLVKFGAADGTGVPAVDAAAFIAGVSDDIDIAVGERVTVFGAGNLKDVLYGGTVARGDPLTSDAQSRAVKSTTIGDFCVGFAKKSGVVGDIGSVLISPFVK